MLLKITVFASAVAPLHMTLDPAGATLETLAGRTTVVVEHRAMLARAEGTLWVGRARVRSLERVGPYADARLAAVFVLDGAVVARRAVEARALVDRLWLGPRFARARLAAELVRVRAVEARVAVGRRAFVNLAAPFHALAQLAPVLVQAPSVAA